jgi:DNA repair exonuclease SbcCD nuclease subunit
MLTFIHTADWQLGKPFARVQDVAKRSRLQQERIEGIRRIGDVVRQRQARFVLVAGDLFDSPTPTKTVVAQALGVIGEIPVPVYAIPGNHDHGGIGSLWEQPFFVSEHRARAPNLHLLLEPRLLERDDAVIIPCPLLRRQQSTDPTAWARGLDVTASGDRPRILLAHGSVATFGSQADPDDTAGPPNVIDLDALPAAEIDYVAIGDWHGFRQAAPKAWYSGTHETDRFPKEGQQPGHVACVTVSRGGRPVVEPVRTGRLDWLEATLDLGQDAARQCEDALTAVTRTAGFDRCLVDLAITGRVSLAARRDLDGVLDAWSHRLLRLDVRDDVVLVPSPAELRELTERAGDPIVSRVATELVSRIAAGAADVEDAREAVHVLHALCRRAEEASR